MGRVGHLLAASTILSCFLFSAGADAVGSRALVELTDIDSLSVSPDGRFLVFRTVRADVVRNSYVLTWHSADLRAEVVRSLGGGGDPIYADPGSIQAEAPAWVDGGRSVVFRVLADGAIGLWRADAGGGRMEPLVVRNEDIEDYRASPDGRALFYTIGPSREAIRRAERAEYDSGILVDSSVDLAQALFRGGWVDGRMASQRLVGSWFRRSGLLWGRLRQQRRHDLLTGADGAAGPPHPAPPPLPAAPPRLQARSRSGDMAEYFRDGESGRISVTFAGGRRLECRDPLCLAGRVTALVWRPGSRDLLITFLDPSRQQSLYLWSTGTNVLRRVASADGLLSGGRRPMQPCAVSASAAFCVASGPASPPQIERVDLGSGERRVLYDPNAAMRASYKPRITHLRWAIGGGRQASGVLLQANGRARGAAPLFVNYYACEGFLRGGEGDEWPIPELLASGFAVACINAVPSAGSQDAIEEYRTGLAAVRALVDRLALEGIADRSKVAMGGFSFGSEVATWIARHSDLLAALSIASAQSDPTSYWFNAIGASDRPRRIKEVWGLGRPEETPQRWKLVSAALDAEAIRVPILLQLPEQEARRIPQFYARLTQSPTPAELYAFPDEGHVKVQPRHRLAVYERNLDWFRYWLQDHRDNDPAKVGQYRRWDRLRVGWRKHLQSSAP